jgi:hypothetical protein
VNGDGDNLLDGTAAGNRSGIRAGPARRGPPGSFREWLRRGWPWLKALLGLAVVAIVGVRFGRDLMELQLHDRPVRAGWAVASGALYLTGLFFSALTWRRLLTHAGERPRLLTTVRAYYLGHLGKYLPGKAWALFLRADLVRCDGVRLGVGVVTAFYEVLVTMSAAVVVSSVLFAIFAPNTGFWPRGEIIRGLLRLDVPTEGELGRNTCVLISLGLLACVGIPAVPAAFNRLAYRLASPFGADRDLPRMRWPYLGEGLLLTSAGWLLQGASLGAALCAVIGPGQPWTIPLAARVAAIVGVSYVAGFVILFAPSGLGVREYFLALFLAPELRELGIPAEEARGLAILTVLLLRVAWTAAEMVMAAAVWRANRLVVSRS